MTDDFQKSQRFKLHLRYAHENDKWERLMEYLETVPEEAWYKW